MGINQSVIDLRPTFRCKDSPGLWPRMACIRFCRILQQSIPLLRTVFCVISSFDFKCRPAKTIGFANVSAWLRFGNAQELRSLKIIDPGKIKSDSIPPKKIQNGPVFQLIIYLA
jgi:hypothetical protein